MLSQIILIGESAILTHLKKGGQYNGRHRYMKSRMDIKRQQQTGFKGYFMVVNAHTYAYALKCASTDKHTQVK
jgi:hypothetical protein